MQTKISLSTLLVITLLFTLPMIPALQYTTAIQEQKENTYDKIQDYIIEQIKKSILLSKNTKEQSSSSSDNIEKTTPLMRPLRWMIHILVKLLFRPIKVALKIMVKLLVLPIRLLLRSLKILFLPITIFLFPIKLIIKTFIFILKIITLPGRFIAYIVSFLTISPREKINVLAIA